MRAILPLLLIATTACVAAGKKGQLGFAYRANDQILPLGVKAPLAVGATVDLAVYLPRGSNKTFVPPFKDETEKSFARNDVDPIRALSALSSNPNVVAVVNVDDEVRLRGVKPGTSIVTVRTDLGTDSIELTVEEVAYTTIDHWLWTDSELRASNTALLRGGTAHLLVERRGASGKVLVGNEIGNELRVEPSEAAELVSDERDHRHARVKLAKTGRLSIVPRKGTGLVLDVVPLEQLARIELTDKGPSVRLSAFLNDGRSALGYDGLLNIASATPDVCELANLVQFLGEGTYLIKRHTPGECHISASLGTHRAKLVVTDES